MGDRVVIVGAGISGLAIARRLAPTHDVVVVDRGGVAADTTSRASGVISLALEPVEPEVRSLAWETFRSLDGRGTFRFTERPTVRLIPTGADPAPPVGGAELTIAALRERFPDAFGRLDGYEAALIYDQTGFLEPLDYAMTLKWLAEGNGATIATDRAMTNIRVDHDRVVGIDTTHGTIDADAVVIATGWRARDHLLEFVELPIRPLRWNAIVVEGSTRFASSLPLGSDPRHRLYWRPLATGDVLVGGNEHLLDRPDETPAVVDDAFRETVKGMLPNVLQSVDVERIVREDCCPTADAATPDGLPVIDAPEQAPAGLVVAAGCHGRGVMLSPVTGHLARCHVTGETPAVAPDPFRLDRFEDRGRTFQYRSHWA